MLIKFLPQRILCTTTRYYATEKSLLATLRKKTGYTFANCKKALEFANNDLTKAEKWLQEQAQAMGWSKATKLEGRQTKQGLIGVFTSDHHVGMVEVNCETDFVARNEQFKDLVGVAAMACLDFTKNAPSNDHSLSKYEMNCDQLKTLRTLNGKSLMDEVALSIGNLGENLHLRRGFSYKAGSGIVLAHYVHPGVSRSDGVILGRFGALVALKQRENNENTKEVAKSICQHIVGMKPSKIGSADDAPVPDVDEEPCLIYQEYIIDNNYLVKDILEENGLEVVDFKRFECGETLTEEDQTELTNNICQ